LKQALRAHVFEVPFLVARHPSLQQDRRFCFSSPGMAPPMLRGGSHANTIDPALERRATVIILQPTVHDHEDFLADVLDVSPRHAQS